MTNGATLIRQNDIWIITSQMSAHNWLTMNFTAYKWDERHSGVCVFQCQWQSSVGNTCLQLMLLAFDLSSSSLQLSMMQPGRSNFILQGPQHQEYTDNNPNSTLIDRFCGNKMYRKFFYALRTTTSIHRNRALHLYCQKQPLRNICHLLQYISL